MYCYFLGNIDIYYLASISIHLTGKGATEIWKVFCLVLVAWGKMESAEEIHNDVLSPTIQTVAPQNQQNTTTQNAVMQNPVVQKLVAQNPVMQNSVTQSPVNQVIFFYQSVKNFLMI